MTTRVFFSALILILTVWFVYAQTGTSKDVTTLNSEVNTLFPDNTSGLITPNRLRQVTLDIIASYPNSNSANSVSNTQLAQMGARTMKCNPTGSTANVQDCTATSWWDAAYCSTVGYIIVRLTSAWTCAQGIPLNVEWFGAASGSGNATATVAAVNAALAAAPNGATILFPGVNYQFNASITIGQQALIRCSAKSSTSNGNIVATNGSDIDIFKVNASNVTFKDCYISRAGSATNGKGIVVGSDMVTRTNATCTNGSNVITTGTATFASTDVGKSIAAINCATGGTTSLFTTIAGFTSSTQITMATTATCGGACPGAGAATIRFNSVYTDIAFNNIYLTNNFIGIHFQTAARWNINGTYIESTASGANAEAVRVENQVNPDYDNSFIVGSYLKVSDTVPSGPVVSYLSNGGLTIGSSKILGGKYGLSMNWNLGLSGQLSVSNVSIENCTTSAVLITTPFAFSDVMFSNIHMTCGDPQISIDNASAAILTGLYLNNIACSGGAGKCLSIGKVTNAEVTGVISNTGGGNPAIDILSNANNVNIIDPNIRGATKKYANAGTNTLIVDHNGDTLANLPATPANGSQIFVTNADPASNPCTTGGASTGSMAFRMNGAWKCF